MSADAGDDGAARAALERAIGVFQRRVRKLQDAKSRPDESKTSLMVLSELLVPVCGWRSARVEPQGSAARGIVDYSVRRRDESELLHLELKRLGRPLDENMVCKYLSADSALFEFGLLTNAVEWKLFAWGRSLSFAAQPLLVGEWSLETLPNLAWSIRWPSLWTGLRSMLLKRRDVLREAIATARGVEAAFRGDYRDAFGGTPRRLREVIDSLRGVLSSSKRTGQWYPKELALEVLVLRELWGRHYSQAFFAFVGAKQGVSQSEDLAREALPLPAHVLAGFDSPWVTPVLHISRSTE